MKKLTTALILLGVGPNLYATVGTNDYGYGVVSKGMGGTGVAQAQNSFSMTVNPANIALLERTDAELGAFIFSPRRSYSANPVPLMNSAFTVAPGSFDSASNWFLVPNFAYTKKLNDRFTTGVSFYGNGGMNTNWNSPQIFGSGFNPDPATNVGVYGGGSAGGELRQMFLNMPLSAKVLPNTSVGVSFLTMIETLSVRGLTPFANPVFTIDPNNFTDRFTYTTFGFGALFGGMTKINDVVGLGASYQTKITPGQVKSYRGLLPGGTIEAPAKLTLGTSLQVNSNFLVNVDYQRIYYEGTRAFGNTNTCDTGPFPCLGTSNGTGFGLKDTNGIKVGGEWQFNELYAFRAGFAYNNNPIRPEEVVLDIITPAVTTQHYTVGLTRTIGEDNKFNLSFLYAPTSSVEGYNSFNRLQNIKLSMYQYEFGASWTWLFDKPVAVVATK